MLPSPEPTHFDRRRRNVLRAIGVGVALPGLAEVASADEVRTVVDFDPPDLPENLAIDEDGNIFMSMAVTRELRKLPADETTEAGLDKDDTDLVATLGDNGTLVTGVAVDDDGVLYAANPTFDPESGEFDPETESPIWSVAPDGDTSEVTSLPDDAFPNGVLIDADHDRLLVSDSFRGEVWAIDLDCDDATTWLDDELLDPDTFVGANGLAVSEGALYVANLDSGRIVRVPINNDGSAGEPNVFVEDESLIGADGITFHNQSTLYVAVNSQDAIRRVNPAGKIKTVVSGDPLDFPADVAFGTRARGHLFVANFAFESAGEDPETANPALLRTHP